MLDQIYKDDPRAALEDAESALPRPPVYWKSDRSGVLRSAVEAYQRGDEMTPEQIAAMRAYLRYWITSGGWIGPGITDLRLSIDVLTNASRIGRWIYFAAELGLDPL